MDINQAPEENEEDIEELWQWKKRESKMGKNMS